MDSTPKSTAADPADDLTRLALDGPAVSRPGDVWELGRHRLVCGDALRRESYEKLLAAISLKWWPPTRPTIRASTDM